MALQMSTVPLYPQHLPDRMVFTQHKAILTKDLDEDMLFRRNVMIKWMQLELVENFVAIGFGAIKSGLAKMTMAISLFLMLFTAIGLYGTLKMKPNILAFHAVALAGFCGVFTMYVIVIAMIGSEKWWLYVVVFCFVVIDLIVAYLSLGMFFMVMKLESRLDSDESLRAPMAVEGSGTGARLALRASGAASGGASGGTDGLRNVPFGGGGKRSASSGQQVQQQLMNDRAATIESINTSDAPSQFFCPIGLTVMADPVIAEDGHSYERENIVKWFGAGRGTSPKTNTKIGKRLVENHSLKSQIIEYVESKKGAEGAADAIMEDV